jgi:hypothetical protein
VVQPLEGPEALDLGQGGIELHDHVVEVGGPQGGLDFGPDCRLEILGTVRATVAVDVEALDLVGHHDQQAGVHRGVHVVGDAGGVHEPALVLHRAAAARRAIPWRCSGVRRWARTTAAPAAVTFVNRRPAPRPPGMAVFDACASTGMLAPAFRTLGFRSSFGAAGTTCLARR